MLLDRGCLAKLSRSGSLRLASSVALEAQSLWVTQARRAQSHCGSYETEILIGAGRDRLGFLIFFPVYSMLTAYIPGAYMPYLSNSAQKRSPKQKRLLFWYRLVAAVGTEILVAFSRYRSRPGDNNEKIDL